MVILHIYEFSGGMMSMKNMKVAVKLIVSFLIVAAMAVAIGVVGIFTLTAAADNTALLSDETTIAIDAARMNRDVQAQRASFRGAAVYQLMNMTAERDNELSILNPLIAEYDELHHELAGMLHTEEGQSLVAGIDAAYAPFTEARDVFVSAIVDPNITDEEMMEDLNLVAATVGPLGDSHGLLHAFNDAVAAHGSPRSICLHQQGGKILQRVPFRRADIGFLVFGEDIQGKEWDIL